MSRARPRTHRGLAAGLLLAALALLPGAPAAAAPLLLGTTTSVDNSGLLAPLLARFTADTGIVVRTVVHGSGAILRLGRSGDVDVVLVHDRAAEDAFVAAGDGIERHDAMASRFLIVGPRDDPAGIAGLADPAEAFRRIAAAKAAFVSRGDQSGTHTAERRLWRAAGYAPKSGADAWYRETGSGMGQTLNVAAGLDGYALTESGSWGNFGNRGTLVTHVDNPAALPNPYGVILVNPARHSNINADAGRAFIAWLTGPAGRAVIDGFRVNGEQPFHAASPAAE